MDYSDRKYGFSTGAIAKGDFQHALVLLKKTGVKVVELSALREHELPLLVNALPELDLSAFDYVSVHAPSKLEQMSEGDAFLLLSRAVALEIPVVVHPDTLYDKKLWQRFGQFLLIENLDKRKAVARTTEELMEVFENFPNAGFCLDLAHARQVDPTMAEATRMLRLFGKKLKQIHASGLNANSTHGAISAAASSAFSQVSHLIPDAIPIILESPVSEQAILPELSFAREAFSPWLRRLRADIDDVINASVPPFRRSQIVNFLSLLDVSGVTLDDFESAVIHIPSGGAYKPGDAFLSARDVLLRLSDAEKDELKRYWADQVNHIATEYPELTEKFRRQFSHQSH